MLKTHIKSRNAISRKDIGKKAERGAGTGLDPLKDTGEMTNDEGPTQGIRNVERAD